MDLPVWKDVSRSKTQSDSCLGDRRRVLTACRDALAEGLLTEVLITGPRDQVEAAAAEAGVDLAGFSIHAASSPAEGAAAAVGLIREGRSDLLMKGHLATSTILRAVLNKETGIRAQALLSHIAAVELPEGRLALLTDAAMNVKPDLAQKVQILDNAIQFAWSIDWKPESRGLASVKR